jgi:hypothetical protein
LEASVHKAQNGPSTQLIEATSYKGKLDAMIGVEDLGYFSSYQVLTMHKNWQSY